MMTTQPDLFQLRANILGFLAVVALAVGAFHVVAMAEEQAQRKKDAVYCVAVWSGSTPDYRQEYNKLCNRGRLK